MKRKPRKRQTTKPETLVVLIKPEENARMPRTFSFMSCQVKIKVQRPESDPPEWIDGWIWVSVRLETSFYARFEVRQITGMLFTEDVKRADPNASFIVEYQASDAVKKRFVHKLNITLIPQDPLVVEPQFGARYKTTVVVSGALNLEDYIPNRLAPFVWLLGPNNIPYISKPNSISPVGGRKNKEQYG